MPSYSKCPQCHHAYHGIVESKRSTNDYGDECDLIQNGCGAVVMVMPERGGLYHEHCDCDFKGPEV